MAPPSATVSSIVTIVTLVLSFAALVLAWLWIRRNPVAWWGTPGDRVGFVPRNVPVDRTPEPTTDELAVDRWTLGECSQFAKALQERYGGTILVRFEWSPGWWNQNLCHAVLVHGDKAWDVKGEVDLDEFHRDLGIDLSAGPEVYRGVKPVGPAELEEIVRDGCDVYDTEHALAFIDRHADRFSELARRAALSKERPCP